ncbi:MAG: hypothetical protein GY788_03630 [bacterium]|nr:hypothetical protein [bacterium]
MRIRIAIVPAAMLCLQLALPTAAASFSNGTSNDTNSFEADILAPATGLGASCGATVALDWTATVDMYATGHRVFRSTTSGGPYSQIAEVTPRTTVTYGDTPAAGIYYYVVRAYYLGWESSESGEALASTGTCAPPLVGGLAPSSGPETGGTSVVISGSGFTGASAVDFGPTPASGYVVDSDTQITATGEAPSSLLHPGERRSCLPPATLLDPGDPARAK